MGSCVKAATQVLKETAEMGFLNRLAQGAKSVQDWWNDDKSFLPRRALNNESVQQNIANADKKEQDVAAAFQRDVTQAAIYDAQREMQHQRMKEDIVNKSRSVNANITELNKAQEIFKNKTQINKIIADREAKRAEEINQSIAEESFNFFRLGEILMGGATLQDALDAAGCLTNGEYNLDYNGGTFIRLNNDACDNVCKHVTQNMKVEDFVNKHKNAIPIAVGYPNTSYSVGLLVWDKDFGFLLLKTDKYAETYATDDVYDIYNRGKLNDKAGFCRIALSKTHIKVAGPCAICINTEIGIESEDDIALYNQMLQYNKTAAQRFINALKYFEVPSDMKMNNRRR